MPSSSARSLTTSASSERVRLLLGGGTVHCVHGAEPERRSLADQDPDRTLLGDHAVRTPAEHDCQDVHARRPGHPPGISDETQITPWPRVALASDVQQAPVCDDRRQREPHALARTHDAYRPRPRRPHPNAVAPRKVAAWVAPRLQPDRWLATGPTHHRERNRSRRRSPTRSSVTLGAAVRLRTSARSTGREKNHCNCGCSPGDCDLSAQAAPRGYAPSPFERSDCFLPRKVRRVSESHFPR